jgi:endonuclease YncB( thermonuclease family)
MILATAFLCAVVAVYDGDTLTCDSGVRVRLAGVNSREMHGNPCPNNRPCPAMSAQESRAVLSGMIVGRTLRCVQVGTSFRRVVATCQLPDGRDLSCALLSAGSVERWDRYWSEYRMGRCDD